jgi:glycerate dehydrogenase
MSEPDHHIVVLDSMPANPGDVGWAALEALGRVTVHEKSSQGEATARVSDATAIVTNKVRVGAAQLDAAPRCRIVCSMATGYDHIDVEAARARGVRVTNVPGYSTATTAQLTIALLLALAHRVEVHDRDVRSGGWSKAPYFSYWLTPQRELEGRKMLIAGGGAIGQRVSAIASAIGLDVRFAGLPGRPPIEGRLPWREGLAWADVVSLHVPLTPDTRHLVDKDALGAMRPGAWLINAARGAVVDETAVARALHDQTLGAYATDVLSTEPPPDDHPLLDAPNCLITPHLGWVTLEARTRLLEETARSIRGLDSGERINVVA